MDDVDQRLFGKGTKAMKAKERLTLVLCCNATGSCKIPPLLIGTAKKPHCFRNGPCPLPYTNQQRAWVDKIRYREWWTNVFLPEVRAFTTEKVALLMDNCAGHDVTVEDPTGQVTVFFFPPNVTSVYQPLDQGIISAMKKRYKYLMLKEVFLKLNFRSHIAITILKI